jgi:hypothetical protein
MLWGALVFLFLFHLSLCCTWFRCSGVPGCLCIYFISRYLITVYLIIVTVMCRKPSAYAPISDSVSRLMPRGKMAPCSTGCARSGILRLGNNDGIRLFNAVPKL